MTQPPLAQYPGVGQPPAAPTVNQLPSHPTHTQEPTFGVPPGMPMAAPPPAAGTNGHSARGYSRGTITDGLVVRPFAGYGVRSLFDPITGALQAGQSAGRDSGVYGELNGVKMVFYRSMDGLAVRVGDRTFSLEDDTRVDWGTVAWRTNRFAIVIGDTVVCELMYRALPPELDLGAHIRAVVHDDQRRTTIFT